MDFDITPRIFEPKSPSKRKSANLSEKYVMDVMLADLSGPVKLSLWGTAADVWLKLQREHFGEDAEEQNGQAKKVYLLVENFRISDIPTSDYNGPVLTTMKCMNSLIETGVQAGTVLSLSVNPRSPYLQKYVYHVPTHPACIHHFLSVKRELTAPFRATLRGSLQDVQLGGVTQQGEPICTFALVDEMGSWVQCCGIGRNGRGAAFQDGNEVVLYYASARKGTATLEALLWLFKDSMIVVVGRKNVQKRMQIELK